MFFQNSFSKPIQRILAILLTLTCVMDGFAIDPANPPESMRGTVIYNGKDRTFNLDRYDFRGANFEVVLLDTDGITKLPIDAGPVRTYRGWCEEEPDSYVEATLLPNGDLRYHVFKGNATDWWYDPPFETNENAAAVNNFTELGGTANPPAGYPYAGATFTASAALLDNLYKTVYQVDMGFDVLVEYMNAASYTNMTTYARKAENAISHFNAIYIRDILAECKLGKVVFRKSNTGLDRSSEQWGIDWWNINTYWDTLFPNADHHFAGFVGSVGGGVAFGCDYGGPGSSGRSFNGWNGDMNWWHVARHEIGHNWGAGDCVEGCPGPDGSTVNSGNSIELSRMSNPEADQIMGCRRGKITNGVNIRNIGAYSYPVPPYANLDEFTAIAGIPTTLDVLGNDYDANGDWITVADFVQTTPLGGTVAFHPAGGPDGRDALYYSPPAGTFGTDKFQYSIVDDTGRTSQGNIIITVDIPNQTLRGYWKLDETTGTTAYDSTIKANHGTLAGSNTFDSGSVTGRFGKALSFDGNDDHIDVSGLNFKSNTVTITAWVNPSAIQSEYAAVFSSRYSGAANFNFKSNNSLGYHWNNNNYNWNSNLTTPVGQWTFVALVIEPTRATIYTSNGTTLNKAVNTAAHSPESFYGTLSIGRDDDRGAGERRYKGSLDDVRIYGISLTEEQIRNVIGGGAAESPSPFDQAGDIILIPELNWSMGAATVNNDVYFGTQYNSVQNADTTSSQYRGRQSQTIYTPGTLKRNTEYFWRIDQMDAAGNIIRGDIWRFKTGSGKGGITRQVWSNITGISVTNLTTSANYPDFPDLTEIINSFEGPTNWADKYGTRIHGFLIPPATGNYTFWIASDDNCQLWLSTDKNPAYAVKIAYIEGSGNNGWANSRQWTKFASQQSTAKNLIAGRPYYIMALQKEDGGGDNLAVAFSGPGTAQQVIPGIYLMPYATDYNWEPSLTSADLTGPDALEGYPYQHSVTGSASAFDGGAVSYSKAAGPLWLEVAPDGTLSGVPGDEDTQPQTFTIRAADSQGTFSDILLNITVRNTFTGELGMSDLAGLAAHWLNNGCTDIPACGGADLTGDGAVNSSDLIAMSGMWLIEKTYGGPASRWPLDTDASDAVSNHDGILMGGAVISRTDGNFALSSGALSLDGVDDYVQIPGYKGIPGSQSRTSTAWIKTSASGAEQTILSWGTQAAGQKWIFRLQSTGELAVVVWNGNIKTTMPINDGLWHHVAAVLPDQQTPSVNQIKLYVDGQLQTDAVFNSTQLINTGQADDVQIGAFISSGSQVSFFKGLINDVRIYNRALTSPEIEELVTSSLQLYLPLNETAGTIAGDFSLQNRSGQLINGPVWQPDSGAIGGVLSFDGIDDYIRIPDYKGVTGTQSRTCSAWIKTSTTGVEQTILSWGSSATSQKWLFRISAPGKFSIGIWGAYIESQQAINDGQWHHVATVLPESDAPAINQILLYIDGVLDTQSHASSALAIITSNAEDVLVGARASGTSTVAYFQGLLDEVRIFDRSLEEDEILEEAGL
ncbi:MAG: LamG-like jellyroll fold domain-containing protein [Anaerohalosphaeraceae bacterium]